MKRLLIMTMLLLALPLAAEELSVGAKAPAFSLPNTMDGSTVRFAPGDGKVAVVVFTCNQCPYAKAFEDRIIALGRDYAKRGVVFYAIDPNDDAEHPEETAAEMKSRAVGKHYPYPYLKDADSSTARAYGARVTPHVFVIDGSGVVRYRGYVDDSARPDERKHSGLSEALDALLSGKQVTTTATKAFGCTIKFKPAA
jgi:peroxiredoxin